MAGDVGTVCLDAPGTVNGGSGGEGRASKMRTRSFARTVVAGDLQTQAHLLQWGHGVDILQARAEI